VEDLGSTGIYGDLADSVRGTIVVVAIQAARKHGSTEILHGASCISLIYVWSFSHRCRGRIHIIMSSRQNPVLLKVVVRSKVQAPLNTM
jgi:hypothetical protein